MQLNSMLAGAGIFSPEDIAVLRKVFDATLLEGDTATDREARAAAIIRLYQHGIKTENALLKAIGYPPSPVVDFRNGRSAD